MAKPEKLDPLMTFNPFCRAPYNYNPKTVSDETGLTCPEPTLAQQQFKDDGDPNVIMEQFARTADMSLLNVRQPSFGDFTGVNDYQSALNAVINAEESFMELPAKLRERFHNDPQELLNFLSDGKNRDEAISLGLLDEPQSSSTPAAGSASDASTSDVKAGGVGKATPPIKHSKKAATSDADE